MDIKKEGESKVTLGQLGLLVHGASMLLPLGWLWHCKLGKIVSGLSASALPIVIAGTRCFNAATVGVVVALQIKKDSGWFKCPRTSNCDCWYKLLQSYCRSGLAVAM